MLYLAGNDSTMLRIRNPTNVPFSVNSKTPNRLSPEPVERSLPMAMTYHRTRIGGTPVICLPRSVARFYRRTDELPDVSTSICVSLAIRR